MSDQSLQSPIFNLQFNCSDCGGVLLPVREGGFVHFECEVGHRYSPQTLLIAQRDSTEYAIWEAIRGATETERLLREIAVQDGREEQSPSVTDFQQRQQERIITFLRQALTEFNSALNKEDGTG